MKLESAKYFHNTLFISLFRWCNRILSCFSDQSGHTKPKEKTQKTIICSNKRGHNRKYFGLPSTCSASKLHEKNMCVLSGSWNSVCLWKSENIILHVWLVSGGSLQADSGWLLCKLARGKATEEMRWHLTSPVMISGDDWQALGFFSYLAWDTFQSSKFTFLLNFFIVLGVFGVIYVKKLSLSLLWSQRNFAKKSVTLLLSFFSPWRLNRLRRSFFV